MKAANIDLNKKKFELFRKEINILGHILGYGVIKSDLKKVKAIQEFGRPNNIKELCSFLGMANSVKNK